MWYHNTLNYTWYGSLLTDYNTPMHLGISLLHDMGKYSNVVVACVSFIIFMQLCTPVQKYVVYTFAFFLGHSKRVQQYIKVKWRIYESMNKTTIVSGNGFTPVRRQPIISNSSLLSVWPQITYFNEILFDNRKFIFFLKMLSAKNGVHFVWASMQ